MLQALKPARWLILAMVVALLVKICLLAVEAVPFNSDEAVVALMARHILQGERPVFFYGQAYMGSLDAFLIAAGFWLLGESLWVVRMVQALLYLISMAGLWLLARELSGDVRLANLAAWLAAVPTVLVTTYTTATLGGYGEALALGNLILLLGYKAIYGKQPASKKTWLALGGVAGLAWWTLGIAGVYILPVAVAGLVRFRRKSIPGYLLCAAGFLAFSSPWWLHALANAGDSIYTLAGSSRPELRASHLEFRALGLVLIGLPGVLGWRHPWSAQLAPLPILALSMWAYMTAGWLAVRRPEGRWNVQAWRGGSTFLLYLFAGIFLVAFLGSPFGYDSTGRYFLPLYVPIYLLLGEALRRAWAWKPLAGASLLVVFLAVNAFSTWQAAASPDRITTQFDPITRFDNHYDQALIEFLHREGELRGYSNYWVSFRLAFLSQEELIYSARIPYKSDLRYTADDDRYPAYSRTVDDSQRVAYITTNQPALEDLLRRDFLSLGVKYQEKDIGVYHVFYQLSRRVAPGELSFLPVSQTAGKSDRMAGASR